LRAAGGSRTPAWGCSRPGKFLSEAQPVRSSAPHATAPSAMARHARKMRPRASGVLLALRERYCEGLAAQGLARNTHSTSQDVGCWRKKR
jgi:hypothetical protein